MKKANSMESTVLHILSKVYGPLEGSFPLPLSSTEAGPSWNNNQRRYLWTDAFGIFALVAISPQVPGALHAARSLMEATEQCLGNPRSPEHRMKSRKVGPGYVGLRIGKVHENPNGTSDAGMSLDGMYWHYVDKWIFALLRLGQACDDVSLLEKAATTAKEVFDVFFVENQGLYWKLTSACEPIPGLPPSVNDDVLSALIVFHCVDSEFIRRGMKPRLHEEVGKLRDVLVKRYRFRSTTDPLGWGLLWWKAQWMQDPTIRHGLFAHASQALSPIHMALPFRFYGALIGAKLSHEVNLVKFADSTLVALLEEASTKKPDSNHFAINQVMLAVALLPSAMERREFEPFVL